MDQTDANSDTNAALTVSRVDLEKLPGESLRAVAWRPPQLTGDAAFVLWIPLHAIGMHASAVGRDQIAWTEQIELRICEQLPQAGRGSASARNESFDCLRHCHRLAVNMER